MKCKARADGFGTQRFKLVLKVLVQGRGQSVALAGFKEGHDHLILFGGYLLQRLAVMSATNHARRTWVASERYCTINISLRATIRMPSWIC